MVEDGWDLLIGTLKLRQVGVKVGTQERGARLEKIHGIIALILRLMEMRTLVLLESASVPEAIIIASVDSGRMKCSDPVTS